MKADRTRVSFGDVVKLNKDRVTDPAGEGIERYVGIEHIEPEDLRIHSWGLVADGTTFTNYFQPGQVLFVKRRAYQRKVAVTDFSGVCSGDIYVLEPKNPQVLLPELLPFICQTESFFEYAVGTSAGSLSPRTNWKQLSNYEFALPPLEEQRRINDLLSALANTTESLRAVSYKVALLEDALLKNVFRLYADQDTIWPKTELRELAYIQTGVAKGRKANPEKTIDIPYIAVSNVQDGFLDLSTIKTITVEKIKFSRYLLKYGDVLMTEGGDPDKLGRGTVWQEEVPGCVHQNHIFAVRSNVNLLDPWFLAALVRSSYGKQYFLSRSKATSNLATINKKQLGNFLVPCLDLKTQKSIVSDWQQIRKGLKAVKERLETERELQTKCLSALFGDTK